jgi:hypothetical protein
MNCAQMLPDGKWEIRVQLDALSPAVRIDPEQQNRFKVYWPGSSGSIPLGLLPARLGWAHA